ncbi:MAG: fasciclin domain-containing protein, partial [Flavobacteriales bacterium]|nr:fasciclin domain-containing protein [Flavobacteriales bacterium]
MKKLFSKILLITSIFALAQDTHTVIVGPGNIYTPSELTILTGDVVNWVSEGGYHDVNFNINSITNESFGNPIEIASASLPVQSGAGEMGSITFNDSGTYNYDCSVGQHAAMGMIGTIVVNSESNTILDIVVNSENHTTLESAVVAAGLVETLNSNGPFTIFAPTDDAFNLLPEGTVEYLLADTTGALAALLTSHVSGGSTFSTSLFDGMIINTVAGTELMVNIDSNGVYIDNALVTVADLTADNGVVHVINAVLVPEPEVVSNTVVEIIVNSPDHTLLAAAVAAAELAETLSGEGPFTVFAPTDAAFALLPEGLIAQLLEDPSGDLTTILTHHVHSGNVLSSTLIDGMMVPTLAGTELTVSIMDGMVQIDNANVTTANIETDNGVVHIIDAVLVPEEDESYTVVDVVVNSENHTTLEAAVLAAGLVETLSGDGPFTVFAPTDAAFALLPEGLIAQLLEDPSGDLTTILTHHVHS